MSLVLSEPVDPEEEEKRRTEARREKQRRRREKNSEKYGDGYLLCFYFLVTNVMPVDSVYFEDEILVQIILMSLSLALLSFWTHFKGFIYT